jgi:thiosulfate reductase cytochrome b subunit
MRAAPKIPIIHPTIVRVTHWVNAAAIAVMIGSGWQIYNASPLFNFTFAPAITIGEWLGGALLWHFAAMWVLAINGALYLAYGLVTKRFWRKFLPLSLASLWRDFRDALGGRLSHADLSHYNAVQRASYVGAIAIVILLVGSGLVLWKPVQMQVLGLLMGGYEGARYVHFFAMGGLVLFIIVHVAMALLVPRSLLAMVRGR